MLPEIGFFALIIALCCSMMLALVPALGVSLGQIQWMAAARPLALAQGVFVALAFGLLVHAFWVDDFSVKVVASHSNLSLPQVFKVTALWGGMKALCCCGF